MSAAWFITVWSYRNPDPGAERHYDMVVIVVRQGQVWERYWADDLAHEKY